MDEVSAESMKSVDKETKTRRFTMVRLTKIGHVNLRVADEARSKAFYRDVLGFRVSEADPEHGGVFMTLGVDFHNLDLSQHPDPDGAQRPGPDQVGVSHIAFQVGSYADLRDSYLALQKHGVEIRSATDHVSQRSIYFADPDGNRLEIYYEIPKALGNYPEGRGDQDLALPVSRPGEPPPAWLFEEWPG